jgi:DNA polymerase-3 subunit epsilon/ATP-dependent DNA helicase DinG
MSNPTIVALDLETTGLSAKTDKITEIGAVRFKGNRVEAEWHSLINPGIRIPPYITKLTGITDSMVRNAPTIHEVLDDLTAFVGDAPVLGHNVRFDLSFLRQHQILHNNEALDTYEIAAVLLPNAGRYRLGALGQALGVLLPATHRALDDAHVTRAVYRHLTCWSKLCAWVTVWKIGTDTDFSLRCYACAPLKKRLAVISSNRFMVLCTLHCNPRNKANL